MVYGYEAPQAPQLLAWLRLSQDRFRKCMTETAGNWHCEPRGKPEKHSADHWELRRPWWRMGPLGKKKSFLTLHRIGCWVSEKPELGRKTLKTEWVINHVPPLSQKEKSYREKRGTALFRSSIWNVRRNCGIGILKVIKLTNHRRKTEEENGPHPSSDL